MFLEKSRVELNAGHSRVRSSSVGSSRFSRCRDSQTGLRERRFVATSVKLRKPKVAGFSIQDSVAGNQLFGTKPRIWH